MLLTLIFQILIRIKVLVTSDLRLVTFNSVLITSVSGLVAFRFHYLRHRYVSTNQPYSLVAFVWASVRLWITKGTKSHGSKFFSMVTFVDNSLFGLVTLGL